MNKYFTWLPIVMVVGAAMYKPVKEAREQKIVNKSISFAIYKGDNYTSKVYDSTSAQVHIIVEKVSNKGEHTIVWENTLASKQLSQYPSMENALSQKVIVPNINDKREHLEVYYILIYNSMGSELQMQNGTVISSENMTKLDISI
jgi:hypothetical protein